MKLVAALALALTVPGACSPAAAPPSGPAQTVVDATRGPSAAPATTSITAPPARAAEELEPPEEENEKLPTYELSAPTPAPHDDRAAEPTKAEKQACAARGGKIQPVCMAGDLECVITYRDGGKRCTDKKDCIGKCLYEGSDPPAKNPVGACQRTSDPCGCQAPIVGHKVQMAFCVD